METLLLWLRWRQGLSTFTCDAAGIDLGARMPNSRYLQMANSEVTSRFLRNAMRFKPPAGGAHLVRFGVELVDADICSDWAAPMDLWR